MARRLPVYLLIDTSGSMKGEPIESVKVGIETMLSTLRNDPYALETVNVSIITYDREVSQLLPLTPIDELQMPEITTPDSGPTHMGAALEMLLERVGERRKRIHYRIRKVVNGTAERPRMVVFRSNKQIYVQVVDDLKGMTLCAAASNDKALAAECKGKSGIEAAAIVGKAIAERALAAGITTISFDRGGYLYHGRVKSLADAAREGGLIF